MSAPLPAVLEVFCGDGLKGVQAQSEEEREAAWGFES